MPHSNVEVTYDSLGLTESLCCLEMAGQCERCHQGVRRSGGSCVLILVSFRLDLAPREDAEGRFLVCGYQAGMRLPV